MIPVLFIKGPYKLVPKAQHVIINEQTTEPSGIESKFVDVNFPYPEYVKMIFPGPLQPN